MKSGTIRGKSSERPKRSASLATAHTEIFIPLEGLIDIQDQVNRIKKDMDKTKADYSKVEAKLANANFVSNAPAEVLAEVKEKAATFQEKLQSLDRILNSFM